LVAMTTDSSRRPRGLRVFGGMLGGLAVLAACEAELPTAGEIAALDAEAVESRVRVLGIDSTVFFVDGVQVSSEEAKVIGAERIASIDVRRGNAVDGASDAIHIR